MGWKGFRSSRDRKATDAEVAQYQALLNTAKAMLDDEDDLATDLVVPGYDNERKYPERSMLSISVNGLGERPIEVRRHNHSAWGLMVEVSYGWDNKKRERKTLAKATPSWVVETVKRRAALELQARQLERDYQREAAVRLQAATEDLGFDYQQHYTSRLKLETRKRDDGLLSYQGTITFGQYNQPYVTAEKLRQALALLGVEPVSAREMQDKELRERIRMDVEYAELQAKQRLDAAIETGLKELAVAAQYAESLAAGAEI